MIPVESHVTWQRRSRPLRPRRRWSSSHPTSACSPPPPNLPRAGQQPPRHPAAAAPAPAAESPSVDLPTHSFPLIVTYCPPARAVDGVLHHIDEADQGEAPGERRSTPNQLSPSWSSPALDPPHPHPRPRGSMSFRPPSPRHCTAAVLLVERYYVRRVGVQSWARKFDGIAGSLLEGACQSM